MSKGSLPVPGVAPTPRPFVRRASVGPRSRCARPRSDRGHRLRTVANTPRVGRPQFVSWRWRRWPRRGHHGRSVREPGLASSARRLRPPDRRPGAGGRGARALAPTRRRRSRALRARVRSRRTAPRGTALHPAPNERAANRAIARHVHALRRVTLSRVAVPAANGPVRRSPRGRPERRSAGR